jgi:hypothetical protein
MTRRHNRYATDPWGRRQHPYRYDAKALRAMIVDDLCAYRPPGGPAEKGAAFLLGACQRVAERDRCSVDDAWKSMLAEASAKLGHECIPALA